MATRKELIIKTKQDLAMILYMVLGTTIMTEKEAIREIKKAERIFTKLSKMGYDLDIRDSLICLSTNEQTKQMEKRLNNTSPHCKPSGFQIDEVIYSISVF